MLAFFFQDRACLSGKQAFGVDTHHDYSVINVAGAGETPRHVLVNLLQGSHKATMTNYGLPAASQRICIRILWFKEPGHKKEDVRMG